MSYSTAKNNILFPHWMPICIFETNKNSPMINIKQYNLKQKTTGILSPFFSPIIKLKLIINDIFIPVEALIDTGAYNFHITPDFASDLKLIEKGIDRGFYPLSGLSETKLYDISFNIDGVDFMFDEEFAELPYGFQFPLILGSQFLSKCKEFHYYNNSMSFELLL